MTTDNHKAKISFSSLRGRNALRGSIQSENDRAYSYINGMRLSASKAGLREFQQWLQPVVAGKPPAIAIGSQRNIRDYKKLQAVRPLDSLDIEREFIWYSAVLQRNAAVIKVHIPLARQYRERMLRGDFEGALLTLDELEDRLGFSLWLIEAKLLALQYARGLERQKEFASDLQRIAAGSFSAAFAFYVSQRVEAQSTLQGFVQRFETNLKEWGLEEAFEDYLRYRIAGILPPVSERFAHILTYSATASIIDIYETMLHLAAKIVLSNPVVIEPLKILKLLGDERLSAIIVVAGEDVSLLSWRHLEAEDAYWTGQYDEVVNLAGDVLDAHPQDAGTRAVLSRIAPPEVRFSIFEDTPIHEQWLKTAHEIFAFERPIDEAQAMLDKIELNLPWAFGMPNSQLPSEEGIAFRPIVITPALDPWLVMLLPVVARAAYLDKCNIAYPNSATLLAAWIAAGVSNPPSGVKISVEGRALADAIAALSRDEWSSVLQAARLLYTASHQALRRQGARLEIQAHHQLKQYSQASAPDTSGN